MTLRRLRWSGFLGLMVAALDLGCGSSGEDAAGDASGGDSEVSEAPWNLVVERALPVVPAVFTVRAHGDVILLRTDDGVWRSIDGGSSFTAWTRALTLDVVPQPGGTALQLRNMGTLGDEALVLERVANDGSASALTAGVSFGGADARWVGGAFTPGVERTWMLANGRLDASTFAPARLFVIDEGAASAREVALPPALAAGSSFTVADLGLRVAVVSDGAISVQRDAGWTDATPIDGFVDLVASVDALVVSRVEAGAARLERWVLDADLALSVDRVATAPAVMTLARGADGALFAVSRISVIAGGPPSASGKALMRSLDGGRTWQTLATGLEASNAFDSRVAVASTGLWSREAMFVHWRPDVGGPWRLAGLPEDLAVPFLQSDRDERWMVTFRQPLAGFIDAGYNLFHSGDRGATWQLSGGLGVSVGCFAVTPDFLFFGGAGDAQGALFETRDRSGRDVIRQQRIKVAERPEAARLHMNACTASGGAGVVVSQAEDGRTESLLHSADFARQADNDDPIDWGIFPLQPRFRISALDGHGVGLAPMWAAGEFLIPDVVGFDSRPQTGFWDSAEGTWLFSDDIFLNLLGGRGATRRHDDVLVYPTGDFQVAFRSPETVTGLGADASVLDALVDGGQVLWLATGGGLFRDRDPIAPPVPAGCAVDFECEGSAGADLCAAQVRCVDGACVPRPAVDCTDGPLPPPCRELACVPATGRCEPSVAPDQTGCGRVDNCHEFSFCQAGECILGALVVCRGATECGPTVCDPVAGCTKEYLAAGTPCGAESAAGACPTRCTGVDDACNVSDGVGAGCAVGEQCLIEGAPCSHSDPCRRDGTCQRGWCVGGAIARDGEVCVSGDACVAGETCYAGGCTGGVAQGDGSSCNDGHACTADDRCEGGFCVGSEGAPECPGLAACPDCASPAGAALLVAWSDTQGHGGVLVLSPRGARLRVIDTPDSAVQGVVHDRVAGDGLWVTSAGSDYAGSIWKLGWDGAIAEEVVVKASIANWSSVGTLDHVPGAWSGRDVFVQKLGTSPKRVAVIDRLTGNVLLQGATFGVGSGIYVDGFAPSTISPDGYPAYWTGGSGQLLHATVAQDGALVTFPTLGATRGLARDPETGDFWVIEVGFESTIARFAPTGQRTRLVPIRFPAGSSSGSDTPDAFDVSAWPGRLAFTPD